MSSTRTPTYFALVRDQSGWHRMGFTGRATVRTAEAYRRAYNSTFQPGGHNDHIRLAGNVVPHLSEVRIVRNDGGGEVVAVAKAPAFEVV